jgi:hypothetical protein
MSCVTSGRPQLASTFKEKFVVERVRAVVLRGQNVNLPESQLRGDGVINVHVEVECDSHAAPPSDESLRLQPEPRRRPRIGIWTFVELVQFRLNLCVDFILMIVVVTHRRMHF